MAYFECWTGFILCTQIMKSATELGSEPMTNKTLCATHERKSVLCYIFCDFKSFCPIIISKGNVLTKFFFYCNAQTNMCSANHSILNCMCLSLILELRQIKRLFLIFMRNKCWGCFFLSKNIKIVKKVFFF